MPAKRQGILCSLSYPVNASLLTLKVFAGGLSANFLAQKIEISGRKVQTASLTKSTFMPTGEGDVWPT